MADPIGITKGLPLRLSPAERLAQQEAKIKEAAQMYEQHFLQEMVKAMRKTVTPGFESPSFAQKLYSEQLDTQYVESWAKRGGIGLGEMIYQQLQQKLYGAQQLPRPAGPLPADTTGQLHVLPTNKKGRADFVIRPDKQGAREVLAPWAGKLAALQALDTNDTALLIEHPDQRLDSRMVFRGHPVANLLPGAELSAGQKLGELGTAADLYLSVAAST
jgi:Rod binding domain-containing protein